MNDSEFKADVIGRTAAQWTSLDPFLSKNDLGIETDTGRKKVGIGRRWSDTPYITPQGVTTAIEVGGYILSFTNGILTSID